MARGPDRELRRLVAADASPLIGLAVAGAFDVLRALFEVVTVTRAVLDEVTARRGLPGAAELDAALREGWIRGAPTPAGTWRFPQLGVGEASTLALALERGGAPLVLMDDLLGRAEASRLGVEVLDLAGLLLTAKRAGLVGSLRPLLARLDRKGFTIADDVVRAVLDAAGEA